MAVPKKKTSKSKSKMRRSHLALGKINVIIDKDSGEYRLPHNIDRSSGKYNNLAVIVRKEEDTDTE
ncbi:MAG: 50S ribosomal protein L32 [Rickettsiaceae bacterium]|nr:MAG: 50S ribosomal protein L32 [Rickettsiaceae bacterium]